MKVVTKTMPVISTGHIDAMAAEWLSEQGEIAAAHHRTHISPRIHVASDVHSWTIYCADEVSNEAPGVPTTLQTVLRWSLQEGYEFVCLDRDADIVDALPIYEW